MFFVLHSCYEPQRPFYFIFPCALATSHIKDVDSVEAGDVVAMFGVDCSSMDTFTDGRCSSPKHVFRPRYPCRRALGVI